MAEFGTDYDKWDRLERMCDDPEPPRYFHMTGARNQGKGRHRSWWEYKTYGEIFTGDGDAYELKEEGQRFFRAGEYDLAANTWEAASNCCCEQNMAIPDMLAGLWTNIVSARILERNFKRAHEAAGMALKWEPKWPKAHVRQGQVYCKQKQWDDAAESFNKALKLLLEEQEKKPSEDNIATISEIRAMIEAVEACLEQDEANMARTRAKIERLEQVQAAMAAGEEVLVDSEDDILDEEDEDDDSVIDADDDDDDHIADRIERALDEAHVQDNEVL